MDWIEVLDIFNKNEHKTALGEERVLFLKFGMNNKRTIFTWDHLQNFYDLNI